MPLFADIALPVPRPGIFTYGVPEGWAEGLAPGMRVEVRVGSRLAVGMVLRLHDDAPEGYAVKPLVSILDEEPVLPPDLLELAHWTARAAFASVGEVVQAMLPAGLKAEPERRGVRKATAPVPVDPARMHALHPAQEAAFEAVREALVAGSGAFLLFGVTGSGKTEVYIRALYEAWTRGKSGIVLVPEIALTPQTVRRFRTVFGDQIAVLHSRLTGRERADAWADIRHGRKTLVIGARSAVFAPVADLGLLIIDEEHDASYRQEDPSPRYDARDVARHRCASAGAVYLAGSATPSLISLHQAAHGALRLLRLPDRPEGSALPEVRILDLKSYKKAMRGPLAVPVYLAVEQALARGEQAILLYNRRGYARYLQCGDCGHRVECPDCSVTLTYHRPSDSLRCHYCGHHERRPLRCPSCEAPGLLDMGSGTQKVEAELEELFPQARILRMDRDSTATRGAHDRMLTAFGNHEYDILVGTQLVSKGLDFPDVTVVAVVHADTELAFPSYRSGERLFQLLTQVAGRSGRASKPGTVYLQTWQPEHPAIQTAARHDFEAFARAEMGGRKRLDWPPFSRLVTFEFKGRDDATVMRIAERFAAAAEAEGGSPVLGPSPSTVHRMQRDWRWELVLKTPVAWDETEREARIERILHQFKQMKEPGSGSVRINIRTQG